MLFPTGPFIGEVADTIVNFTTRDEDRGCAAVRRVKSQEWRVESQKFDVGPRSRSGSRLSTLDSRLSSRSGVTLVELLITILIISILAALILGVAAVAGETAREAHTRNIVTRLHTLLMEHYDTYKTRRVKLQAAGRSMAIQRILPDTAAEKGKRLAEARLYALRELMLMEVPDRWSDVLLNAVPADSDRRRTTPAIRSTRTCAGIRPRAHVAREHLSAPLCRNRRPQQFVDRQRQHTPRRFATTRAPSACTWSSRWPPATARPARCSARADIGDTDGDGALEFLDGWGHPINFLRWAPGFDSQIQINANQLLRRLHRRTTLGRRPRPRIMIRSTCSASIRPRSAWCR